MCNKFISTDLFNSISREVGYGIVSQTISSNCSKSVIDILATEDKVVDQLSHSPVALIKLSILYLVITGEIKHLGDI